MVSTKTKWTILKETAKESLEKKTEKINLEKIKSTSSEILATAKSVASIGKDKAEELYNGVAGQTIRGTVKGFFNGTKNSIERIYDKGIKNLEQKAKMGDEDAARILAAKDKIEVKATKGFEYIKNKYTELINPESEILPEYNTLISIISSEMKSSGSKNYEKKVEDTTIKLKKELMKKNVVFSSGKDTYKISIEVDKHNEKSDISYRLNIDNSVNQDIEAVLKEISQNIKEIVLLEIDQKRFNKYSSKIETAFNDGKGGIADYLVDINLENNNLVIQYVPLKKEKNDLKGITMDYNIKLGGQ